MADRAVKVTVTAQVNNYLASMDAVAAKTRATASEADKLKARLDAQEAAFKKAGTGMVVAGGLIAAGLALAVKKAADFDAQMAQLRTLSNASAGTMLKLRDAALTAGQGIGASATQVADAQIELQKANVGVTDQLNGALKGALNLAAAGQLDVADATQIAASAMTEFKLKGKDVPHIADLLAAGADKALGSVQDLGNGLKFVGPVADSMGISLEQTVGTLALFAQNAILGEQGGTSLRGVLLSLTSPSALAQKTMEKYGITLYDAAGKFVGINGAAEQLKVHLGGLDQATRNQALGQIFGNEQITAATVLMQGGAKQVDKWTASVNDSGFAAKQASGKMNSLNGDLTKMKAAFDSALIGLGESAQGPLRDMTKSITGVLNSFNGLPDGAKEATFAIGGVTAAALLLGGTALLTVPKIAALKVSLIELGVPAGKVTGAFSAIGAGMKAIPYVAVAAGVIQVGNSLADAALQATGLEKSVDGLSASFSKMGIKKTIDDALGAFGDSSLAGMTSGGIFSDIQNSGDALMRSALQWAPGFNQLSDAINPARANLDQLDKTLANMVASGDATGAADAFNYLATKTDGSKDSIARLRGLLPEYTSALKGTKDATQETAGAQDKAASSAKNAADAYNEEATQTSGVTSALKQMMDQLNAQNDSQQKAISANASWRQGLADLKKQVKDNGTSLDESTAKGSANADMLSGLAGKAQEAAAAQYEVDKTTIGAEAATKKYTGTLAAQRQKFEDAAAAAGFNKDQVKHLADQVFQLPSKKAVDILLNGAKQAEDELWRIAHGNYTATVYVRTVGSQTTVGGGAGRNLGHATGGYITGPGTSTSDSIYARLSNGEFVVRASQTARNLGALQYINNGGVIPGFATGGVVATKQRIAELEAKQRAAQAAYDRDKSSANKSALDSAKSDVASAKSDLANLQDQLRSTQTDLNTSLRRGQAQTEDGLSLVDQLFGISSTLGGKPGANFRAAALKDEAAFLKLTKQSDAAATALDKAKTRLSDLKDAAVQMTSTVAQAVRGFFNLGDLAQGSTRTVTDAPRTIGGITVTTSHQEAVGPTAASIAAGLKGDASHVAAYAGKLAKLRKMGLNPALLAEIASSDPATGEQIADALLGASAAQISSINSSYSAVGKFSTLAGKTVSDANYAGLITAAQKQVDATQKNADKITAALKTQTDRIIAQITSALKYGTVPLKRAGGGPIVGLGSSTSDDVLVMGSNGEYVLNASAYSRNRRLVEYMNRGGTFTGFVRPVYASGSMGFTQGGGSSRSTVNNWNVYGTDADDLSRKVVQRQQHALFLSGALREDGD